MPCKRRINACTSCVMFRQQLAIISSWNKCAIDFLVMVYIDIVLLFRIFDCSSAFVMF